MTVHSQHDTELWQLVRQGDGPAFKLLFDQYWEKLYVYAYNRLKLEADAQDVVQEVMIKLWLRRSTVVIQTTLAAYLHAAVQYELLAHLSRALKSTERKAELERNILPDLVSQTDPLLLKELLVIVETEVSRLPPKMQRVYRLTHEENLSIKEIAGRLGLSEQTVRNQLNNSYQKLRVNLKNAVLAAIFLQHI
ncbi:RNA polymerase sigma factor [Paraflavitalea pollutisoli]|uniref:RNA polymerase sigma factor n=1 Tax=Paraflavitalea pollutisoli TaxID=3034143 RepID=UPI0023EA9671|nr:sigma-70 family RNA polymerase sigma factor [Paraflavitalea sp. H1-2-19X]